MVKFPSYKLWDLCLGIMNFDLESQNMSVWNKWHTCTCMYIKETREASYVVKVLPVGSVLY